MPRLDSVELKSLKKLLEFYFDMNGQAYGEQSLLTLIYNYKFNINIAVYTLYKVKTCI